MFIFCSTAISLSVFLFSLHLGMCTRILRVVVTYAVVVASLSFYVFPCLPVSTNEAVLSVCVSLARFVFFFFSSSPLPLNFPTEFCFYILSLSPSGRLSAMVAVFRFGRRLHEKWEESRRRVTRGESDANACLSCRASSPVSELCASLFFGEPQSVSSAPFFRKDSCPRLTPEEVHSAQFRNFVFHNSLQATSHKW